MTPPDPVCPCCGSHRSLPFEKEDDYSEEYSPEVAVYAGITLVSLIIGLLLFSIIYFRIVILAAAVFAFYRLNRRGKKRRRKTGNRVCLDCSASFRG